jgi:hypothetical protein
LPCREGTIGQPVKAAQIRGVEPQPAADAVVEGLHAALVPLYRTA